MRSIVGLFSVMAFAVSVNAQAACPNLSGVYQVAVEPFGGLQTGPHGKVRIGSANETDEACEYALQSKVDGIAFPLQGNQTLIVAKTENSEGALIFTLKTSNQLFRGSLLQGRNLILSVTLTGCGGEGSSGSSCGEDLILMR